MRKYHEEWHVHQDPYKKYNGELHYYASLVENKRIDGTEISKPGYLKQRMKLDPEAIRYRC